MQKFSYHLLPLLSGGLRRVLRILHNVGPIVDEQSGEYCLPPTLQEGDVAADALRQLLVDDRWSVVEEERRRSALLSRFQSVVVDRELEFRHSYA